MNDDLVRGGSAPSRQGEAERLSAEIAEGTAQLDQGNSSDFDSATRDRIKAAGLAKLAGRFQNVFFLKRLIRQRDAAHWRPASR